MEMQSVHKKDQVSSNHLALLVIKEFLPYTNRCFQAIFQPSLLSTISASNSISNDISLIYIDKLKMQLREYMPDLNETTDDQGVDMEFKNNPDSSKDERNSVTLQEDFKNKLVIDTDISGNNVKSSLDDKEE